MLSSMGCKGAQERESGPLDGEWMCASQWNWDNDGVSVPCDSTHRAICTNNKLSFQGYTRIGKAQWSERGEASCYGSEKELYGKRISTQTTPINEAALTFEKEHLEGKALGELAKPEYRVRISSRSENKLVGANLEGRVIQCERIPSGVPSAWHRKGSHRLCKPMIAAYPDKKAPSCQSLHMCANEAAMSRDEQDKLYSIIKATPDCPMP